MNQQFCRITSSFSQSNTNSNPQLARNIYSLPLTFSSIGSFSVPVLIAPNDSEIKSPNFLFQNENTGIRNYEENIS